MIDIYTIRNDLIERYGRDDRIYYKFVLDNETELLVHFTSHISGQIISIRAYSEGFNKGIACFAFDKEQYEDFTQDGYNNIILIFDECLLNGFEISAYDASKNEISNISFIEKTRYDEDKIVEVFQNHFSLSEHERKSISSLKYTDFFGKNLIILEKTKDNLFRKTNF